MHIYRSTRLKRRNDTFDHKFDELMVPILNEHAFAEVEPYCFRRIQPSGCDVIYFSVTPSFIAPSASFCPNYINEIDEIYDNDYLDEEPHIGMYNIITPKGVFSHSSCSYKCKLAKDRDKSLTVIAATIPAHVIPYFLTIHDPARYAGLITPNVTMYYGRSHEVIGMIDKALIGYNEMFRRCMGIRERTRTVEKFANGPGSRAFVYLSLKLQRELEFSAEVQKFIDYYPSVKPFPEILFMDQAE